MMNWNVVRTRMQVNWCITLYTQTLLKTRNIQPLAKTPHTVHHAPRSTHLLAPRSEREMSSVRHGADSANDKYRPNIASLATGENKCVRNWTPERRCQHENVHRRRQVCEGQWLCRSGLLKWRTMTKYGIGIKRPSSDCIIWSKNKNAP